MRLAPLCLLMALASMPAFATAPAPAASAPASTPTPAAPALTPPNSGTARTSLSPAVSNDLAPRPLPSFTPDMPTQEVAEALARQAPAAGVQQPITLKDPLSVLKPVANTTRQEFSFKGQRRAFLLHVPLSLPRGPTALVISLHAEGMSAAEQEQLSGFSTLSDQKGFIVAYPEGLGQRQSWNFQPGERGADDVDFMTSILESVTNNFPVSLGAIFVTGIGNGAQMAARLACVAPEKYAAVGLVGGNYPQWADCKARPYSAILLHGTEDKVMPYNGRLLNRGSRGYADRLGKLLNCTAGPAPVANPTHTDITGWDKCDANTAILLFTIPGMGHNWPGSLAVHPGETDMTVNASAAMWEFFNMHQQSRWQPPSNR